MIRRQLLLIVFATLTGAALAQGPAGTGQYYLAADGKSGAALKTALCDILQPHVQRTYAELWTDFGSTDLRPDGYVWDMYSCVTSYVLGDDQNRGNTGPEGTNYNREHSMPNSWFNKEYPMYTDLHHMYPTDSYVNNRRGNEPFGEVSNPTWQSAEGFSKLGPARDGLGYQGTVFEPADEYKGDFARTYFYMVTAYETYTTPQGQEHRVASWNSPMLAQNQYPALTDWAVKMLLRWSEEDPVSDKETQRNEAIWQIQQNRNPFIDYPGLEQYIWGSKQGEPFSYDGSQTEGIREWTADSRQPAAVWYDLQGRKTVKPAKRGVYVKKHRNRKGRIVTAD